MKPPSRAAITKALGILLDSIQEENGLSFKSSCTYPLNVIPLDQLGSNVDALHVAKSSLEKEADDLIFRIQVHRNAATPTYRIPPEVFEMIFNVTLQMNEGRRTVESLQTLLKLMGVCRHWYTTILNCPRLWTYLDADLRPDTASLVIERSRNLPILSLSWDLCGEDDRDEDKEETLWMVFRNSSRFKSMSFRVGTEDEDDIWSLLESTTTALEGLTIDGRYTGAGDFTLSDGAPLKYLSLDDVSYGFGTQRLSGLVILRLYRKSVPGSLEELIRVLEGAAAQLEELTLVDSESKVEYQPSSPITFPRLRKINLERISNSYSTALVATIYAPACSDIRVQEFDFQDPGPSEILDAAIWKPGNTQMAAFLGLESGPEPRALRFFITADQWSKISIKVSEQGAERTEFQFRRCQPWRLVELIREFFLHHPSPLSISLDLRRGMFEKGPLDLISWSGHLEVLSLSNDDDCLRALEQLSQRPAAPSWSGMETREDWVCPNLQSIMLRLPDEIDNRALHVAALRSLVQKRWSGADGGFEPANQPTKFYIACPSWSYKELQTVETEIREIVPCFMFCIKE
ncbi:hypothetical protein FRC01_012056 [Tulasnella sp. 417]|nr:hypothetical protein FRC01_012056 [Tulasnella sp. 417]